MNKTFVLLCLMLSIIFASPSYAKDASAYQSIEWVELMPKDDLEALLNPPTAISEIADGSAQDNLEALGSMDKKDEQTKRYYEALNSSKVVESFEDKAIKIPGFIVPLISNEQNLVTEFFIVPYFGACLHMPPPPPNQIIYAKFEQGIKLDSLYNPFWFEGSIKITNVEHELGNSAYTLNLDKYYLYEE